MPKTRKTKSVKATKIVAKKAGFLSQIKWGESYTSLFLGAVVVVVALVLAFSFIKSKNLLNKEQTQSTSTVKEQVNAAPKTYTVKSGDYLWSISEKVYGSGYNWVDLANVNNLENPGVLYAGTKLIV